MERTDKIYVAGHTGLLGSALVRRLRHAGYGNLLLQSHRELDLTDAVAVRHFFSENRPRYVFLAAAKVGGILANETFPAEFIFENLKIQTNVSTNPGAAASSGCSFSAPVASIPDSRLNRCGKNPCWEGRSSQPIVPTRLPRLPESK